MPRMVIHLNEAMEVELNKLAIATGRSKSYCVKQALSSFLEERSDYLLALAALERGEPRIDLAEVRRELSLER